MSLHKNFSVRDSHTDEVLEEFGSMEAAEKFMIMMQSKGESVRVITDEDDVPDDETPDEFNIEGLEIDEPTVEFGNDLDEFNEDAGLFDTDKDEDVEFD